MNESSPAGTRADILERLEELRQQGTIDMVEEGVLLRHYDDLVQELTHEKQRLLAEYEQRCTQDGQEAADAWLADAVKELGRRQREATLEVFSRCGGD